MDSWFLISKTYRRRTWYIYLFYICASNLKPISVHWYKQLTYLNCTCTMKSHLVPEMSLWKQKPKTILINISNLIELIALIAIYTEREPVKGWQFKPRAIQILSLKINTRKLGPFFSYSPENPLQWRKYLYKILLITLYKYFQKILIWRQLCITPFPNILLSKKLISTAVTW